MFPDFPKEWTFELLSSPTPEGCRARDDAFRWLVNNVVFLRHAHEMAKTFKLGKDDTERMKFIALYVALIHYQHLKLELKKAMDDPNTPVYVVRDGLAEPVDPLENGR